MVLRKINSERDKLKQMGHIRNLLAIAITDGSFDNQEKELIFEIGIQSGLNVDDLKQIDKNPASITYIKPDSKREQIEQLYDLILLMLANNKISNNELNLCKTFATKLGMDLSTANTVILYLIDSIPKGKKPEEIIKELAE